jgi:N-acetyl-anhydromuramyl-L-alanine amidase AmpD
MGAPALAWAAVAVLAAALAAGPSPPAGAVVAPGRVDPSGPRIDHDPIPYGRERKQQMATYSKSHYGHRRWRLVKPSVVVLHFTGGSGYQSAWNTFAANAPARGELPGVCTHYVVGKDGVVHRLVRLAIRCRHAIGLNHRSIGIEMVQPAGEGSHWAARQILGRRRQVRSGLELVRYLRARFGIKMRHVIGHAMANTSPYFKDLRGWRNDHVDWLRRDVEVFRRRLARIS